MGAPHFPEVIEVVTWRNHYECPCGEAWTDRWCCQCDDECPSCGADCSPSESEDLETEWLKRGVDRCTKCGSAHDF